MPRPIARPPRIFLAIAIALPMASRGAVAQDQAPPPGPGPASAGAFDVIIAGGTTAAFAAAVASAESGARTCLLEPTDWVGGQITASGVPAIDEAWHKITDPKTKEVALNVAAIARDRANMTPNFRAMLDATGNPGKGWVSQYCFEPRPFLEAHLLPLERRLEGKLVVFRETVVKRVDFDREAGQIRSLTAIRRTPKPGLAAAGYDRFLSEDLPDWYDPRPSARFDKEVLTFAPAPGRSAVFLDATEWGEVLVLADAPYLQGAERVEGGREGDDRCGQATVYDFVQRFHPEPVAEPDQGPADVGNLGFGMYSGRADAWPQIWTYRRIRGTGPKPAPGDLSLQNWGYSGRHGDGGNDYPFGYMFKSRADAAAERADWRGGVDLGVLAAAERRALAWHDWFKRHAPEGIDPGQITLDRETLGTAHGLAKMPYVRDTRRSVGLDGFLLSLPDLSGPAANLTGKRFRDRVALGAYEADIHPLVTCTYPPGVYGGHATLPFLIPFRALTSEAYGNLLVAGKTMAQSFMANSATRLHPIEWSTGTAAGVAAAFMARTGSTSRQALDRIGELQDLIRARTPIEWTIDGETYPRPDEVTPL